MPTRARRNVCFVTGTRAEFGLMARALAAVRDHPSLGLQIVATGMHLDRSRGDGLGDIGRAGFEVHATVPWPPAAQASQPATAAAMGRATADLADAYARLKADVVLVVGDRVEALAAAAAAHVSGLCVAHVHGGDRAPGVVDDSLRHAVTKLAHLHFPATAASAARIVKLGEDRWRVRRAGSPGIDGIVEDAAPRAEVGATVGLDLRPRTFALVALHPTSADEQVEYRRAADLLDAVRRSSFDHAVVVYPNNDPGSRGIVRCHAGTQWGRMSARLVRRLLFHRSLPRGVWLGLLRDAAVLVGNSSSGIIEAASFGTPVIDVGPRQHGREHGPNVVHVGHAKADVAKALARIWNRGKPVRYPKRNVYGRGGAGERIAETLAGVVIDERLLRKLIAY